MKTQRSFFYKKEKLFGAGHPQLPEYFALIGDKKKRDEFFEEHETTHARFDRIYYRELPAIYKGRYSILSKINL